MLFIQTGSDNSILRKKSREVKREEIDRYLVLAREMVRFIKDEKNQAAALAAPQVGYAIRLIVMHLMKTWNDTSYKTIILFNPTMEVLSYEYDIEEEWCLSLPGYHTQVERFKKIKVNYIDEKKEKKTLILSWVAARIFQHELDHLNGILLTDKTLEKIPSSALI